MVTVIDIKEMPLCGICGNPLRRVIPDSWAFVPKKPWNYQWNGKCESCGYTYNIYHESSIAVDQIRIVTLVAASHKVLSPIFSRDTFSVLSGVDVESKTMNGELCLNENWVFLSGSELKKIIEVISNRTLESSDFSFSHSIDNDQERVISLHRDSLWIDAPSTNYDTDDFLFGFTIETSLRKGGKISEHESFFLTDIESEYIVKMLKDSPLLEQWDFSMDCT